MAVANLKIAEIANHSPADVLTSPASLPARVIAAIIDYIVVSGLFIAVSTLFPESLPSGIAVFAVGALYFSLAHSFVGKGQTIGKALLGLRVYPVSGVGHLTFSAAFLRYFLLFGILIVISEAPPALYRERMVVAPSWQLELHMLVAFAWFFANTARVLADSLHRGFHDLGAASCVFRPEIDGGQQIPHRPKGLTTKVVLAAALLSALPWWLGLGRPPAVEEILMKRYPLEKTLNIRLLNAQATPDEILIEALILRSDSLRSKHGRDEFSRSAAILLHRSPGSPKLRFRLYSNPGEEPLTQNGQPLEVVLDSDSISSAAPDA